MKPGIFKGKEKEIESMAAQATLLGAGVPAYRPDRETFYNKDSYDVEVFHDAISGLSILMAVIDDHAQRVKPSGSEHVAMLHQRIDRLSQGLSQTSSHTEKITIAMELCHTAREFARSLGVPFRINVIDRRHEKAPRVDLKEEVS